MTMIEALGQEDVVHLLRNPSPDSKIEVVQKIAGRYNTKGFRQEELRLSEQIFRLLLRDTEQRVRVALAEMLKDSADVPRDIIQSLLRDVDEVAIPIIEHSQLILDSELVQIIHAGLDKIMRQLAVARRQKVSEMVSASLVGTGRRPVILTLLRNPGANIHLNSYQKLLDDFAKDEEILGAVSERNGVPIPAVEKLMTLVSEGLKKKLSTKYGQSMAQVSGKVDQAREMATLNLLHRKTPVADAEKLAAQLKAAGRLTPNLLMTALCRGHITFFEVGMAKLAGFIHPRVIELMYGNDPDGILVLCQKAGMPQKMWSAVEVLVRTNRQLRQSQTEPGTASFINRMTEALMTAHEEKNLYDLPHLLSLVRANLGK